MNHDEIRHALLSISVKAEDAKTVGDAATFIREQAAENGRLRGALRDLINAYLADVNPNDRNQAAIEHARRHLERT